MAQKIYFSYKDIHKEIENTSEAIKKWKPDVMVAIGGGGFIPARILRTFLRIPILAVGLRLYDDNDKAAAVPEKTQWFDDLNLKKIKGKRALIVDEVDDTRTTLSYCVEELKKEGITEIAIFVIYNKLKDKHATLPKEITYFSGKDISDLWVNFPWEATNIEEHFAKAGKAQPKLTPDS